MSKQMFSARVDELIGYGMTLEQAISQTANESAHYVDAFTRMRQEALDCGTMIG